MLWKYFELSGYNYLTFTEFKGPFLRFLELLLIVYHEGRRVQRVRGTSLLTPAWSVVTYYLGEEALNEPNSVGIFMNAELLP